MIKLALSDMDNTLIPFGEPYASTTTLGAIRAVRAAGVQFGPSTGRDYHELLRFFQGDASAFQTGVISNGKKVYVDGRKVYEHDLDLAALQRIGDAVEGYHGAFLNVYPADTDETNPIWIIGSQGEDVDTFRRRYHFTPRYVRDVPQVPVIAATIACPGGDEACRWVVEVLSPQMPEFDIVMPTPDWFDIIPHGVSKASGLRILMAELGLTPSEVVVFGDAANDEAVLRMVPNSVAVANATPEIAAIARYHIGACADDGVAVALHDIARAARAGRLPDFMREQDGAA